MSKAYAKVQEHILRLLEQGVAPWRQPWASLRPQSLQTGNEYHGINAMMLSLIASISGYESPWWATFNTIKEKDAMIRKGEASPWCVIWWRPPQFGENSDTGEQEMTCPPLLRYTNVWNVGQTTLKPGEDYPVIEPSTELKPMSPSVERAAEIIAYYPDPPKEVIGGDVACYRMHKDTVYMPSPNLFPSRARWYLVYFHEGAHAAGHEKRVGGLLASPPAFGSEDYSAEELIAEWAAAMLAYEAGLDMDLLETSAAYINHWRQSVKDETALMGKCLQAAKRRADYILGRKTEEEPSD